MKKSLIALLGLSSLLCGQVKSSERIALHNINLIDVVNQRVLPEQTVLIQDNKIVAVQTSSTVLSETTIKVDLSGKYLSPGLIDAHVHHATEPDGWDNDRITRQRLRTLLRGGVTAVRDMGGDARALAYLKRRAMLDVIQSPDIYYSVIIGGPEFFEDPRTIASAKGYEAGSTFWMRAVTDESDLDEVMLTAKGTGATGIKIYAKVPAGLLAELSEKARKHGLKVWAHAYVGPSRPGDKVTANIEVVSHAPDLAAETINNYVNWRRKGVDPDEGQLARSFVDEAYTALLDRMKHADTMLDATLTVFEERKSSSVTGDLRYKHATMLTRLAHEHGIKIVAGTDAFSDDSVKLYKELQLLVEDAGLTPFDALQAATWHNAQALGIADTQGTVEKDKIANLVLFEKDPTSDINNIASVTQVIKNGQFIYRGERQGAPFEGAKLQGGVLWLSGKLGTYPGTSVLAGDGIESQTHQAMKNIGAILQEYNRHYDDLSKCTLILADINDFSKASETYKSYFNDALPTRTTYAASGLALSAKIEIECHSAM